MSFEAVEDRATPSVYGDFNHDGRQDVVDLATPTTVTVRLANPDGSLTLAATLKVPSSQPIQEVAVFDVNADGDLDVVAYGSKYQGSRFNGYEHVWLGHGDGTFDARMTYRLGYWS
ncbi:MAG: VCBS repeat-containing protein [Gemmataceae bacterium]